MCLFRYHKGELFCRRGWQKAHWFLFWPVYFWSAVAIPSEDCAWSEESSRNCNWSRFFFNLAVVKKVTIFFNNVMYLDDAFRSLVGPYIRSIWNRNISVFPNSLVMYNFLKFAPIMECFFIEFVSDITWDSITFELIIQVISLVKFCCRISSFSRFILQ